MKIPRPRRRTLVALGVAAAVGALTLVVSHRFGLARDSERLSAAVARLDAAEPGWRAAEFYAARNAKLPPAGRSAGELAVAAVILAPPSFSGWGGAGGLGPVTNVRPDPARIEKLFQTRDECAQSIRLLRRALAPPAAGVRQANPTPGAFASSPAPLNLLRGVANLLALDSAAAACEGDSRGALRSCVSLLDLAQCGVGDEPSLQGQRVRIAVGTTAVAATERALAWRADPPPELLERLQAGSANERKVLRTEFAYRGERAALVATLEAVEAGEGGVRFGAPDAPNSAAARYLRLHAPGAKAYALEFFEELIAACGLPDPARGAALDGLNSRTPRLPGLPSVRRLVGEMLPDFAAFDAEDSPLRARLACLEVALACERFRLATGHFPACLADLPPDLLAVVPMDPYTGEPLMLKRDPEGLTVYSTGPDKTDDGGTSLSERGGAGTDIGVRLWDAAKRSKSGLPTAPNLLE